MAILGNMYVAIDIIIRNIFPLKRKGNMLIMGFTVWLWFRLA
jgi:hypothetical protein